MAEKTKAEFLMFLLFTFKEKPYSFSMVLVLFSMVLVLYSKEIQSVWDSTGT